MNFRRISKAMNRGRRGYITLQSDKNQSKDKDQKGFNMVDMRISNIFELCYADYSK